MRIPGIVQLTKKISFKILRVIVGLTVLLTTYICQKLFLFKFRVVNINFSAPKVAFNLSMHYEKDELRYISMGREYFSKPVNIETAALYIGETRSLSDVVVLTDLDTSILFDSLVNFVRLEDPRCFEAGGRVFAFCACIFSSKTQGYLGYLTASQVLVEIFNYKVVRYKLFISDSKIEKNWVIYKFTEDYVDFVYSILPFKVIRTSLNFEQSTEEIDPCCYPSFKYRNSTNYVTIDNTMYSVGHSTIDLGIKYAYLHFFIKLDHGQEVLISRPFVFKHFGNEFATCLVEQDNQEFALLFSDHEIGNFAAFFSASDLINTEWHPLKK